MHHKTVILKRYLYQLIAKETLMLMAILLLIVMSIMFVQYLSRAANGAMIPGDVAKLILYMVPHFITVLLPACLYLSVILVLGRLFSDNELFVMLSSGLSSFQLLKIVLIPSIISIFGVSLLVFYLNPIMMTLQQSLTSKGTSSTIDMVSPGRFVPFNANKSVLYISNAHTQKKNPNNIFFYRQLPNGQDQVVTAPAGYSTQNKQTNQRQIVMINGHQYKFTPDKMNVQRVDFNSYTQNINLFSDLALNRTLESTSLIGLWKSTSTEARTELQWRLSMPIMVFILTLLGLSICYLRPKESRFAKIIPAFLLYMIYYVALVVARNWLSQGRTPIWLGLWWVHGLFLVLAIYLLLNRERVFSKVFRSGETLCGC